MEEIARLDDRERAFVASRRVARLATVDARGEPYLVPVCFAYDGTRFLTPIDEKPKRGDRPLKRVRNIQATGRAALLFDHYDDADWSRLAWVMVRGAAAVWEPDHPDHAGAVALLRARYRQYAAMALEALPVIAVTPRRIMSWGALERA